MWDVEECGCLLYSGATTECLQSFFSYPCECAASKLASCVHLLNYLGHDSVDRHVFDLDGVCHVGEMISAPADVLKGTAGKVNYCARAKARPPTQRCMFIQQSRTPKTKQTDPKTNTHTSLHTANVTHTQTKAGRHFSADTATGANTYIFSQLISLALLGLFETLADTRSLGKLKVPPSFTRSYLAELLVMEMGEFGWQS